MKKILVYAVLLSVTVQMSANAAEWSNVFNYLINNASKQMSTSTKKESTTTYNTTTEALKALSDLKNQASQIDNSVQNTFLSLVSQLSKDSETKELQSKLDTIMSDATKTQDDMAELMSELMIDYAKKLNQNKAEVVTNIKNMSDSEQTKLINTIAALTQEGQDYLALAKQGVNTASNAMKTAKKVNEAVQIASSIKKTASEMQTTAKSVISVSNQIRSIAKSAGIVF